MSGTLVFLGHVEDGRPKTAQLPQYFPDEQGICRDWFAPDCLHRHYLDNPRNIHPAGSLWVPARHAFSPYPVSTKCPRTG